MSESSRSTFLRVCAVLLAAVLWGTYGSFVTYVCGELGLAEPVFIALRFIATFLPVLLLLLVSNRSALRIHWRDLWLFILNGLASIVFFTACYTAAVNETKIATAAALLYTAPAIVMVASVFIFNERMSTKKLWCVVASVVGCALVSGIAGEVSFTIRGLLLGLGAGFGYALYSIVSRVILARGYSAYTNVLYTFGIAACVYSAISLVTSSFEFIPSMGTAVGLALLCGILTGFIAYVLYTWGLAGMEATRASQLATIEPVVAVLLGTLLFKQALSIYEILGVVLVLGAVIVMNAPAPRSFD